MSNRPSRSTSKARRIALELQDYPLLLVSRVLLLLAGAWTEANIVRRLDSARVLAES